MKALWLTWERQRRNRSMSELVGAEYHELTFAGHPAVRRIVLAVRTLLLIAVKRPDCVYYQNPSMVLALLVTIVRRLTAKHMLIVGDFHNAGVYPPHFRGLTKWIARSADLVIVSNHNLGRIVKSWGASYAAIPDPLPSIAHRGNGAFTSDGGYTVFFICSWSADEPVVEVIEAARRIEKENRHVRIIISGKPHEETLRAMGRLPENVVLAGYMPASEFDTVLRHADIVMDLTTRDDCMVCGAYEGVAAERPMILSGNEPTRSYFDQGVLFTDNSANDIAYCLLAALDVLPELNREVAHLKTDLLKRQSVAADELKRMLDAYPPTKRSTSTTV